MNIFFDVQGTLLTEDSGPRPHVREFFLKLSDMGHHVYLWSTAGDGYAAHAARVLGVDDVVRGCFGKRSVPEDSRDHGRGVRFVGKRIESFKEERLRRKLGSLVGFAQ
jgi:phosphoserine phosphatase